MIKHVAVGVIVGDDGQILIAKRADHLHQGGLWEFPGGKLHDGEHVVDALVRELREELAIEVTAFSPLMVHEHHYPDKSVVLDIWLVTEFEGEPTGNEGQPIKWVATKALDAHDFPEANWPIIEKIKCLLDQ